MQDVQCSHLEANDVRQVCIHLHEKEQKQSFYLWFSEPDVNYKLICNECSKAVYDGNKTIAMRTICDKCFWTIHSYPNTRSGVIHETFYKERPSNLYFSHKVVELAEPLSETILDIQPLHSLEESVWIALTDKGHLSGIDLTSGTSRMIVELAMSDLELLHTPPGEDVQPEVKIYLSPNGQFTAIVNRFGQFGIVVDLNTGSITMRLERENYHLKHCDFPIAFFEYSGRTLLMHGTEWNRVDISDPDTGAMLTVRPSPLFVSGQKLPEHYLEYFHCGLLVSPDYNWVADNGWIWTPVGSVTTWNVYRWLQENVWESEDGISKRELCEREDWSLPICWIDDRTLAVWGYGDFSIEDLISAVRLFDVVSGHEISHFFGPSGSLVFDEFLFSFATEHGTAVWDIQTGERLYLDPDLRPQVYHRGAKQFLTVLSNREFRLSRLQQ